MARTALVLGLLLAAARPALAGGGPETTVVVVNAASVTSRQVGFAWAERRGIPPSHVLLLDDVPGQPVVSVDDFRERILRPLLARIAELGLEGRVDTVAYAPGFPYGVDFDGDAKAAGVPIQAPISRIASLTGLTYLYRHVLAKDAARYLDLEVNGYFRRPGGVRAAPTRPPTAEEAARLAGAEEALRARLWSRAADAYEAFLATYPDHVAAWYNLACCRAVLGRADAAIEALERAVEHGWRDAAHTREDPDLASLRGTDAFRRLLEAMGTGGSPMQPTMAFDARAAWTGGDAPVREGADDAPDRYLLAVMLGWTGAHGSTAAEVLASLDRAAGADGTHPDGTVYLLENDDVRARTRMPFFAATADALRALGRKVEVLTKGQGGQDGILPRGRDDAVGVVAGIASFRCGKDDPPLLPGAIAEHLTSFGAHFGTASQTKCTSFLAMGAAATSGTVAEPYAIPQKFPLPQLHVHYARGCSAAEAFYQSVWGPYQLLILGDPLARPFATLRALDERASGVPPGPWSGTVTLTPVFGRGDGDVGHVELWVDGLPAAEAAAGAPLAWDTSTASDGEHDLALVAVDAGAIATRSTWTRQVRVANGDARVTVDGGDDARPWGPTVGLAGHAHGGVRVVVRLAGRDLASAPVAAGAWRAAVPTALLAPGRVPLDVVALDASGGEVAHARHVLALAPPDATAAAPLPDGALPGLALRHAGADGQRADGVVTTLAGRDGRRLAHDLRDLGAAGARTLAFEGFVHVASDGPAELVVEHGASVRVRVDGAEVLAAEGPGTASALLGLAAGWHAFAVETEGDGAARLAISLGGGADGDRLAGDRLRHAPADAQPALRPTAPDATAVVDGQRGGEGVAVDGDGVVLTWDKPQRDLVGVVLFPGRGEGAPPFPSDWVVETRSTTSGRWRAVADARTLACPPSEPPARDASPPPTWVEVRFRAVRARQVRVRPATEGAAARLAEVEVLARRR